MQGVKVSRDIYIQICGNDLIRDDKEITSASKTMRAAIGVSYLLENREAMKRAFPNLYSQYKVKPVDNYPDLLLKPYNISHRVRDMVRSGLTDTGRLQQRLL